MRIFVTGPEGSGNHITMALIRTSAPDVLVNGDSLPTGRPAKWFALEQVREYNKIVLTRRDEREAVYSAWKRFNNETFGGIIQFVWQYRAAICWQNMCQKLYGDKCVIVDYSDTCSDACKILTNILGYECEPKVDIRPSSRRWHEDKEFVSEYNLIGDNLG